MNVTLWHKNIGGNFRQLIDLKELEVCDIAGNVLNYPMLSGAIKWFNTSFPSLLHRCPYTVWFILKMIWLLLMLIVKTLQSVSIINASLDLKEEQASNAQWHSIFPNGNFKLRLHVYDDLDDNIVDYLIYLENHLAHRDRMF